MQTLHKGKSKWRWIEGGGLWTLQEFFRGGLVSSAYWKYTSELLDCYAANCCAGLYWEVYASFVLVILLLWLF